MTLFLDVSKRQDQTGGKTYHWLKNNRELTNVATSRAKEELVVFSSSKNLERLHQDGSQDEVYELVKNVKSNGTCGVTSDAV